MARAWYSGMPDFYWSVCLQLLKVNSCNLRKQEDDEQLADQMFERPGQQSFQKNLQRALLPWLRLSRCRAFCSPTSCSSSWARQATLPQQHP
eukprot:5175929-Amphidinium_carterae.1